MPDFAASGRSSLLAPPSEVERSRRSLVVREGFRGLARVRRTDRYDGRQSADAVLHILLALRRTLRERSPGAGSEARFGAVSFLHRFGSSLNPHFHYHGCVLVCPRCGQTMRLLAFLTDPFSIRHVLSRAPREARSGEPTRPPKLHPPRGPPEDSDPSRIIRRVWSAAFEARRTLSRAPFRAGGSTTSARPDRSPPGRPSSLL